MIAGVSRVLAGDGLGLEEEALEVELRDRVEGGEVLERGGVDDGHQVALAVEEAEDAVQLVGDLVEAFEQLLAVHLEDGAERGERLQKAAPLVEAAHALHQEALRGGLDDVGVVDLAELDLEGALVPDEGAVDGLLAAQAAKDGVDALAVAEEDVRLVRLVLEVHDAALAVHLEGLDEVDHAHVGDRAGEAGAAREVAPGGEALARAARDEEVHAGDELAHEDRLGEVASSTPSPVADLVLDRLLAGEEDDGDGSTAGVLLELPHERIVHDGEASVGEHEVRRTAPASERIPARPSPW
ncbi:MAG: hypothetical protein R3F14_29565 [Polyangiaceae bacterium]